MLQGCADLQGFGNALSNAIYGNTGNNLLDGGVGADSMYGGAGNDTYFVDNAGDVVVENASEGFDTVFSTVNLALTANVENLVLQGTADLQGYGNASTTRSTATAATTSSTAAPARDSMYGGAGNDTYFVDNAGDVVVENANEGTDAVFSTADLR